MVETFFYSLFTFIIYKLFIIYNKIPTKCFFLNVLDISKTTGHIHGYCCWLYKIHDYNNQNRTQTPYYSLVNAWKSKTSYTVYHRIISKRSVS